jgi:hypothetical protein
MSYDPDELPDHVGSMHMFQNNNAITSFAPVDKKFISTISFVPSDEQLDRMIGWGNRNVITVNRENQNTVITKSPTGFAASNMVLKASPFYKFGQDLITGENCKDVYERKKNRFAFIRDGGKNDNKFPFSFSNEKPTMGLNGILVAFDENAYGAKRVNLFQGDKDSVFKLLEDFITFRDENAEVIFLATLSHMTDSKSITSLKMPKLYREFIKLIRRCRITKGGRNESQRLDDIGLGLRSFCQSWDPESGRPRFSIASPHFQTRVVVSNIVKFKKFLYMKSPYDSAARETTYNTQIEALCEAFVEQGYAHAFIDLDGLLNSRKPAPQIPIRRPWIAGGDDSGSE